MDSDDYVELSMYEKMYNKAKEENSDMVECDFIWEYPNKIKKDIGSMYSNKNEAIEKARVVAWNKLIKTEIIKKQNLEFPVGLRYEDVEFFYKLVPNLNKISFVKECFVHYVQRENSIVNTQNLRTKEIFTVLENVIEYYKKYDIFEKYFQEIEYIYVRFLLCSSLKRMCKIKDKEQRKEALKQNWENINTVFPNWRKNKILKKHNLKNIYIKSCNMVTYRVYCFLLKIL